MRSIWLIFGFLLTVLLGFAYLQHRPTARLAARSQPGATPVVLVSARSASPAAPSLGQRDSLVRFALRQLGTPYVWAGTSPATGFDCSGFITYVFGHFGVATPHATALLIDAGQPVPRAQAQPGDIVVFTGTAEGSTTPGHAGIVISALGETPLHFVHASSARRESGVKISQVENSGYERRFMQVRRVLGIGEASAVAKASQPARIPSPTVRPAGAVAPLATAAPTVAVPPAAALPATVAPLPIRPRRYKPTSAKATPTTKRHLAPKATTAKKPLPATRKVVSKKPTAVKKPASRAKRPARVPSTSKYR